MDKQRRLRRNRKPARPEGMDKGIEGGKILHREKRKMIP